MSVRGRLGQAVGGIAGWSERYIPSAFVIACLLTLATFGMVLGVAGRTPTEALGFWAKGFWELLEFTMQMSLILLTGYMVAVSPVASRVLDAVAGLAKSNRAAVVLMALVAMGLSWVHWGLGNVGSAIFLGFLIRRHPKVDYRLAVACGYLGVTCTWHAGLSGSAPLLMATPKHFMEGQIGVIPISTTTLSPFNLVLTAVVVAAVTLTVWLLYPRDAEVRDQDVVVGSPAAVSAGPAPAAHGGTPVAGSLAAWLDTHYAVNLAVGLLGVGAFAVFYAGQNVSLNLFNFAFLFLALLLHPSPASFTAAASRGVQFLHGIILQFPFYAGMYGLIHFSGLAETIGHWFVSIASPHTFPFVIYLYSGVLSYFIPSGGSKWAVEAPYVLAAARTMGVPAQQAILAYAWGDMSTHFLQPFWALPLLTIARLEFKDILGYLGILFVVNGLVVSAAFLLMPYVW